MKKFIILIALLFSLALIYDGLRTVDPPLPETHDLPQGEIHQHEDVMIMEATAYTLHEGSGCGITKTGTVPVEGRTVAVDPEVIPLGSKLTINGQPGYIAEDTGGAVKGNRIDIYMLEKEAALYWGRQPVEVEVTVCEDM